MFKRRHNEAWITVVIEPVPASLLLVKEGEKEREQDDGTQAPMMFVESQGEIYLPGSSLKGVIREGATQIASRWFPGWTEISDPFDNVLEAWSKRTGKRSGLELFNQAGPIERCFGIAGLQGRWKIEDAFPPAPPRIASRTNVAIDRNTGTARDGHLFTIKAVESGSFTTTISLVNYELWQLGLLAHTLHQMDTGVVRIGYGKQRGYGRVNISVTSMGFRWLGRNLTPSPSSKVRLPSLHSLTQGNGYDCKDGEQELDLPLEGGSGGVLGRWTHVPSRVWKEEPWPSIGPLMAGAIKEWRPSDDMLQTWREMQGGVRAA